MDLVTTHLHKSGLAGRPFAGRQKLNYKNAPPKRRVTLLQRPVECERVLLWLYRYESGLKKMDLPVYEQPG